MNLLFDSKKSSISRVQVRRLIRQLMVNDQRVKDVPLDEIKEHIAQLEPSTHPYNYMIMDNENGETIARFPWGNHATAVLIDPIKRRIITTAMLHNQFNLSADATYDDVVDYLKSKTNKALSLFCKEVYGCFADFSKLVKSPKAATVYAAGECLKRQDGSVELNDFSGGYHHSLCLDQYNNHQALFRKLELDDLDFKYTTMIGIFCNLQRQYQTDFIKPILVIAKFIRDYKKQKKRVNASVGEQKTATLT